MACMYVWSSHIAEYGSTGEGCQSCSSSAEQGKLTFPCPRTCLRIWSRETGSAVPSHVTASSFSILRQNLVLTHEIPPDFRGGVHLWIPTNIYTLNNVNYYNTVGVCVCVCFLFFPFILDIKFVGRTSRGHTGGLHRISHPPSFCGACLNFSREKDSAISFPRRP